MASLLQLQILNDCNEHAKPKLQEAYQRILSIAKVHEALYDKEDMTEISFTDYLTSVVETTPNVANTEHLHISIQDEQCPLTLNVNLAIPLGLLINEIMNLTPVAPHEGQQIHLSYNCEGDDVTITLSGLDKQVEEYRTNSEESGFHHLLIDTFLQQINATIKVNDAEEKGFVIRFQKLKNVKGAGNSLFEQENNELKKSVA